MTEGFDNVKLNRDLPDRQQWDFPTRRQSIRLGAIDERALIIMVAVGVMAVLGFCCVGGIGLWVLNINLPPDKPRHVAVNAAPVPAKKMNAVEDRPKGQDIKTIVAERQRFAGHTGEVVDVAFAPDGQTAVSGGDDKIVFLWDVESGNKIHRFAGHTARITGVGFTPNGQKIVSGSDDKTVRVWDVAGRKELHRLDHPERVFYVLRVTPDGERLLSSTENFKTIHIWDLQTAKQLRSFGYRGDIKPNVWISDFSMDGKRALACGLDNNLRVWDVDTGKMLRVLDRGSVHGAFSNDGRLALAWGRNDHLRLYEVESGQFIRRFADTPNGVHFATFSQDGNRVLTSDSRSEGAALWDVQSGLQLCRLESNPKGISAIRFSPDGQRALSAGRDGSVRLWRLQGIP